MQSRLCQCTEVCGAGGSARRFCKAVYLQQPDSTLIDKCKAQQSQRKLDNARCSVVTRRFLNCCFNSSYNRRFCTSRYQG